VLVPNKKPEGTGPAFSGEVVGAPNAGAGTVVAPPIGGAGVSAGAGAGAGGAKVIPGGGGVSVTPGGVPSIADPSSPTGRRYLTPDEVRQQQPQVVAPPEEITIEN
jgi:hypothetical protein